MLTNCKQNTITKLVLLWIFSITYLIAGSQTLSNLTTEQWREDINYFADKLQKKHKNIFHNMKQEEFNQMLNELTESLPKLKYYEIVTKLLQITAKVGDAHTFLDIPASFKRYPIVPFWYGNELYVNRATDTYKNVLGRRIIKIGNTNIEDVNKKLATVLTDKENQWFFMSNSPGFMLRPEILVSLGIVPDLEHASFTFADENNKETVVDLIPVELNAQLTWLNAAAHEPLFRQHPQEFFWFTYLDDINAVYVNFKKYDDLKQNVKKLFEFIEEKKATRLIIDLRMNGGGDFTKVRDHFIPEIKKNAAINQQGNLFVLTSRRTFSAAMTNSIDFKKQTHAIIVGEPPGERPNSYQENDEMKLPNSGIKISYSTKYYKFLDEDVDAFQPDVRIDPTWKDYTAGKDAALEWIIEEIRKKKI